MSKALLQVDLDPLRETPANQTQSGAPHLTFEGISKQPADARCHIDEPKIKARYRPARLRSAGSTFHFHAIASLRKENRRGLGNKASFAGPRKNNMATLQARRPWLQSLKEVLSFTDHPCVGGRCRRNGGPIHGALVGRVG